mmetsp:Transcript_20/g.66  ORF Transcript_20/g.66 Transcript_20/m.66 type:complete len:134 (+) Transcript_20:105-506(+)|eukprot:CAMPEP_0114618392 /NCGR_PEP_ID=MMETSP0168-20121206/7679_1 /TAXON_ID=95228 ORGANISM="Vannella sp., Strain DIVA3 517/6/12" /NCGR_SAMPLE_ID=MMETSP0168 /ASSEMBLY_ACC=CAM_ASM_000044 /LENGTH=133 /DNA_ID=CAMNT_0001829537 /DNA_START=38 /DNA_END=439 /DNA_ORIENTATION=-
MSINGVRQLQRVVIHYSPWGGSSAGTRKFVESGLAKWVATNPNVDVVLQERPKGHPFLVCEHLKAKQKPWTLPLRNESAETVEERLNFVRNTTGATTKRSFTKKRIVRQEHPTLQGGWTPELGDALRKASGLE